MGVRGQAVGHAVHGRERRCGGRQWHAQGSERDHSRLGRLVRNMAHRQAHDEAGEALNGLDVAGVGVRLAHNLINEHHQHGAIPHAVASTLQPARDPGQHHVAVVPAERRAWTARRRMRPAAAAAASRAARRQERIWTAHKQHAAVLCGLDVAGPDARKISQPLKVDAQLRGGGCPGFGQMGGRV